MIGGRRTRKKAVGENASSFFQFAMFWLDMRLMMRPIKAPRKTITTDSGTYWKLVCSIRWISRMASASTHSTKKIDIELLCSSSAEPFSGSTGSEGATVVVDEFVVFTRSFAFWVGRRPGELLSEVSEGTVDGFGRFWFVVVFDWLEGWNDRI